MILKQDRFNLGYCVLHDVSFMAGRDDAINKIYNDIGLDEIHMRGITKAVLKRPVIITMVLAYRNGSPPLAAIHFEIILPGGVDSL